jgi:uncharacterized Zn finger protein (UPF0148 family)
LSEQDYPLENQFDIIHVPCSAHLAFVSKDLNTGVLFYVCPVCHRKFAFGEITEAEQAEEQPQGQAEKQPEPQTEKKPRKRRKSQSEASAPTQPQGETQEGEQQNDSDASH